MGSLYRRAQTFLDEYERRRAELRIVRPGDMEVQDDREISAEDRTKILGQIDEVVARTRIAITSDTFRITPKRAGWVFPTLVNLVAVIVVGGGITLAVELGRRAERSIIAAPTALATTEGKLLEAFKEESRQELEGKDKEIADIRGRLEGIDQEKERIRQEAEAQVATRERELRDEYTRSLEAERARLAASGLGEVAIADRLKALEAANSLELDKQLGAVRDQAEAERAEQERTIEQLRAEYEKSLSTAQDARSKLAEESARRQSELEAGARQRQLALEQEKSQALQELASLRKAEENERLVLDQFLSFYKRARDAIQARDAGAARGALADFRKYLDEPTVAGLPGVAKRRQVELFLIGALEESAGRIETEAQSAQTTQSLVASANLVTAVADLVQQGDTLFQRNDYTKARDMYLMALSRIPAVQAGQARLQEIDTIFRDRTQGEVNGLIAAAGDAYRAGDYDRAAGAYAGALERMQVQAGVVDTLMAQLREIGARSRETELTPRIRQLEQDVATQTELARTRTADLEAARAEVASLQKDLDASRAAVARLEQDRGASEAALADARAQIEARTSELNEARSSLAARTSELVAARADLDTRGAELEDARSRLEAGVAALAAAQGKIDDQGAEILGLRSRVDQVETAIAAVGSLRDAAAGLAVTPRPESSREELLALLQTKLLVQRVLMSDQVLREYPDLYQGNEKYLQALVSERSTQARLDAQRELDALLGRLTGGGAASDVAADIAAFSMSDENTLLLGILDKLRALLG